MQWSVGNVAWVGTRKTQTQIGAIAIAIFLVTGCDLSADDSLTSQRNEYVEGDSYGDPGYSDPGSSAGEYDSGSNGPGEGDYDNGSGDPGTESSVMTRVGATAYTYWGEGGLFWSVCTCTATTLDCSDNSCGQCDALTARESRCDWDANLVLPFGVGIWEQWECQEYCSGSSYCEESCV